LTIIFIGLGAHLNFRLAHHDPPRAPPSFLDFHIKKFLKRDKVEQWGKSRVNRLTRKAASMYNLSQVAETSSPEPDTYILDLHRTADGLISISSDQTLSQYSLDISRGPLRRLVTDHGNLTQAKVVGHSSIICTAGADGTAAIWDLRQQVAKVAQFDAADTTAILSLACNGTASAIAVGTELAEGKHEVGIFIWDVRGNTPTRRRGYVEVHSDDITELKFHPSQPHLLLSGSTDGLVNVCDTNIADEDEVIVQTFNHDASIHHAGFLSQVDVFAVSHDERFAVFSLGEEHTTGTALVDYGDLRPMLDCQYVANVTTKTDGSGAIIGAGAQG
jgi:WD repeat-containing protein 89